MEFKWFFYSITGLLLWIWIITLGEAIIFKIEKILIGLFGTSALWYLIQEYA